MRIALIGTRGVPAQYGGFETAVEEIGRRLVERGHDIVVYCRNRTRSENDWLGMELVNLPAARRRSLETLSHSSLSVGHALVHRPDAAIVFNAANSPLVPALRLRGVPAAIHMDGLEWKRSKWGPVGQRYYRLAERLAVRVADVLIADSAAIADYYWKTYDAPSWMIAYGATVLPTGYRAERLEELDLSPGEYLLVVSRIEPENHTAMIVGAHAQSGSRIPLVVAGGNPYETPYVRNVRALAHGSPLVRWLGPVWDQELLDALYANTRLYLHGHSVGGTNPSLLRAMGAGAPVAALDVDFNREVLGDTGRYFERLSALSALLVDVDLDDGTTGLSGLGARARERAQALYDWDRVAELYEQLCGHLVAAGQGSTRTLPPSSGSGS